MNYLIFQSVKRVTLDIIPFTRRLDVLYYMLHTSGSSWLRSMHMEAKYLLTISHELHLQRCIECQFCLLNKGEKTPPYTKKFSCCDRSDWFFLTISVRCKWYIEKKEWIIIKSKKFLTSKWESLLSYMLWPHLKYQCHSHNGWNLIVISVWNFRATLLSIYIRFL